MLHRGGEPWLFACVRIARRKFRRLCPWRVRMTWRPEVRGAARGGFRIAHHFYSLRTGSRDNRLATLHRFAWRPGRSFADALCVSCVRHRFAAGADVYGQFAECPGAPGSRCRTRKQSHPARCRRSRQRSSLDSGRHALSVRLSPSKCWIYTEVLIRLTPSYYCPPVLPSPYSLPWHGIPIS